MRSHRNLTDFRFTQVNKLGQKCSQSNPVSLLPSGKSGTSENHIVVIVIIISVGAFIIILVVVGAFLCTRRTTSHQKK